MEFPNKPIQVTQPHLPDLKDFIVSLEKIWENKWLTNNGEFHQEFERRLAEYLGVKYISVFNNGTLALITALKALNIKGEVITTPYSFVATSHALHWNGIIPVFADIDPIFGNVDPEEIEKHITPNTTAILPVQVYGNPTNNEKITKIAKDHNLKVINDSAHAFGVKKDNDSILLSGDLSILSFHATKTFNTIEGGAIICHDKEMKDRIDDLKNFGFKDEVTVISHGINAKMNELQAAFGLLELKSIDEQIEKRGKIAKQYRNELSNIEGLRFLMDIDGIKHNYSYFPIFISKNFGISRDRFYLYLKENNVFCRRYFYPLISNFPVYDHLPSSSKKNLSTANTLSDQVLCLPIYSELSEKEVIYICNLIKKIC